MQGSIIANPFYAVNLADYLFDASEPKIAEEDWVLLNADLVQGMGAKAWLEEFLDLVSLEQIDSDSHDIINPTLTIRLSANLHGTHYPLVTRENWVKANMRYIEESGVENWLRCLLQTLARGM